MSQTLTTIVRYLLNTVLFSFILFFCEQIAGMMNQPVEAADEENIHAHALAGLQVPAGLIPAAALDPRLSPEAAADAFMAALVTQDVAGPSASQVNAAIRALVKDLPQGPDAPELLPEASNDIDQQAERLLHLWQLLSASGHDNELPGPASQFIEPARPAPPGN